jgi:hypothetical protein
MPMKYIVIFLIFISMSCLGYASENIPPISIKNGRVDSEKDVLTPVYIDMPHIEITALLSDMGEAKNLDILYSDILFSGWIYNKMHYTMKEPMTWKDVFNDILDKCCLNATLGKLTVNSEDKFVVIIGRDNSCVIDKKIFLPWRRVIDRKDIPPGFKVIKTPFGDRLVPSRVPNKNLSDD